MQRYDIDESRGYPVPVIVPDDLGDCCLGDYCFALKKRVRELTSENNDLSYSTLYMNGKLKELGDENTALREALENIVLWAKGSTCEICGEKKMTDTDAYDYAKAALRQKETS